MEKQALLNEIELALKKEREEFDFHNGVIRRRIRIWRIIGVMLAVFVAVAVAANIVRVARLDDRTLERCIEILLFPFICFLFGGTTLWLIEDIIRQLRSQVKTFLVEIDETNQFLTPEIKEQYRKLRATYRSNKAINE